MDEIKNQEKEEVDMCQALQEIFDDGRNEGFMQGRELGLSEGREQGLSEGHKLGLSEGRQELLNMLSDLVHDGILNIAQAAEKAGKSEEEFKQLIQK